MEVFRKGESKSSIDFAGICGCARGRCCEPRLHEIKTSEDAAALRLDIQGELAGIKDQLLQASSDRHKGIFADGDWFRSVNTAKNFKSRQMQWLQDLGAKLRKAERLENFRSSQAARDEVEAIFRKLLRKKIGDDAYVDLRERAEELARELDG